MKKIKDWSVLFGALALLATAIVWAYSTFSTITMANTIETNVKIYVDQKHDAVQNELVQQREILRDINERTITIIKEMRKP